MAKKTQEISHSNLDRKIPRDNVPAKDLFAPCGMFCGFCTSYLSMKYSIPRRRGIITYCKGCRPRDKQCSFIKKRCNALSNKKVDACYYCEDFPCKVLDKIAYSYSTKFTYSYSFIEANLALQERGAEYLLDDLTKKHGCKKCGEILCIHNGLCYNCDKDTVLKMKNYRNDP